MNLTSRNFCRLQGALGLAGLFLFGAQAWGGTVTISCGSTVNPQNYNPNDCNQGGQPGSCSKILNDLRNRASNYSQKQSSACSSINPAPSVGGQSDSQAAAQKTFSDGKAAMQSLIQMAQGYQTDTQKAAANIPPIGTSETSQFSKATGNFRSTIERAMTAPDVSSLNDNKANGFALTKSAQLITELQTEISKRQETADSLQKAADNAGSNNNKTGAADKGMDPSSLASLAAPLASLAGLAKNSSSATDTGTGISSADSSTGTAASVATLGSSTADAPNKGSGGQSASPGGSATSTSVATDTNTAASNPPSAGANISSASKYPDAFTGVGSNGMGSYGSASTGGSAGGAGGSTGANADRWVASTGTDSKTDEALASFGGGSLNSFSMNQSKTDTSTNADAPVKDFLQDAQTNMGDNGNLAAAPEQTGVQPEESLELFQRVHTSLERSQRKGTVLMGLGGQI